MNIRCPECDAVYRVDPDRVPANGVRARCQNCQTVLAIGSDGSVAAWTADAAPGAPAETREPAPAPSAPEPEGEEGDTKAGAPVFGPQDPDTRAKRLARALVSDIVVYNPDRRKESLEAGTLRADFREEILKSWEEYVEQVGEDQAKRTPYFRDALNEILAEGQKVF